MPARRSAASSSGRESGLRPGAPSRRRTSSATASSSRGRAPRGGRGPSRSVEQPLVDVDAPRHAGVGHLGRGERAGGLGRDQQAEAYGVGARPRSAARWRCVLDVRAQVLRGVVGAEQGGLGGDRGAEQVPAVGVVALQQAAVHGGRAPQDAPHQAEVVAARDPDPCRQQRGIPPRGVVPHPARGRLRVGLPLARPADGRSSRGSVRSSPASVTSTRSPRGARAGPGSWEHPPARHRRRGARLWPGAGRPG